MRKQNWMLSCFMAFLLIVSGCSSNKIRYEIPTPKEEVIPQHENVKFSDLTYQRPDIDAINKRFDTILSSIKEQKGQEEVLAMYDQLLEDLSTLDTMLSLVDLHNSIDLSNQFYEEEHIVLENTFIKLDNRMLEVTKEILDSKHKDAFVKKMGQDFIDRYEKNANLNSPEIEALSEKETELKNEYNRKSIEEYTTMLNGKEVGLYDLDFTKEEDITAYYEIYQKKNHVLGTIYQDLIKVRVEIANTLGYDTYTDYAYDCLGRDYTKEEAQKFEEQVQRYIVPLYQSMERKYSASFQAMDDSNVSVEQGVTTLEKALKKEFPDAMSQAFSYMKTNELYTFTDSKQSKHSAYTSLIGNQPYLYLNKLDYNDLATLFHEFGHYYNFYLYEPVIWGDGNNLDLAEVHSQGLELLLFPYYEEAYGEHANLKQVDVIYEMLNSIIMGAVEDEFQRKVFENPTMSLDEMNQLHKTIYEKYFGYPIELEWVDIPHHFETPFYYISYATSATSALEVWCIAQEDRNKGLQAYRNITQYTTNSSFIEPLEASGLSNPFTSDLLQRLAKEIKKQYL